MVEGSWLSGAWLRGDLSEEFIDENYNVVKRQGAVNI